MINHAMMVMNMNMWVMRYSNVCAVSHKSSYEIRYWSWISSSSSSLFSQLDFLIPKLFFFLSILAEEHFNEMTRYQHRLPVQKELPESQLRSYFKNASSVAGPALSTSTQINNNCLMILREMEHQQQHQHHQQQLQQYHMDWMKQKCLKEEYEKSEAAVHRSISSPTSASFLHSPKTLTRLSQNDAAEKLEKDLPPYTIKAKDMRSLLCHQENQNMTGANCLSNVKSEFQHTRKTVREVVEASRSKSRKTGKIDIFYVLFFHSLSVYSPSSKSKKKKEFHAAFAW